MSSYLVPIANLEKKLEIQFWRLLRYVCNTNYDL
jgi:hypothetical protein